MSSAKRTPLRLPICSQTVGAPLSGTFERVAKLVVFDLAFGMEDSHIGRVDSRRWTQSRTIIADENVRNAPFDGIHL